MKNKLELKKEVVARLDMKNERIKGGTKITQGESDMRGNILRNYLPDNTDGSVWQ